MDGWVVFFGYTDGCGVGMQVVRERFLECFFQNVWVWDCRYLLYFIVHILYIIIDCNWICKGIILATDWHISDEVERILRFPKCTALSPSAVQTLSWDHLMNDMFEMNMEVVSHFIRWWPKSITYINCLIWIYELYQIRHLSNFIALT